MTPSNVNRWSIAEIDHQHSGVRPVRAKVSRMGCVDSNQHKLGCAIYPDRAWSETDLTEDSLAR